MFPVAALTVLALKRVSRQCTKISTAISDFTVLLIDYSIQIKTIKSRKHYVWEIIKPTAVY